MHLNAVKQIHQSLLMNDNPHAINMRVSLTFDDINGKDDRRRKSPSPRLSRRINTAVLPRRLSSNSRHESRASKRDLGEVLETLERYATCNAPKDHIFLLVFVLHHPFKRKLFKLHQQVHYQILMKQILRLKIVLRQMINHLVVIFLRHGV